MSILTRRAFAASLAAGSIAASKGLRASHRQPATRPSSTADLAWLSLTEAADLVKTRRGSPVELTTACLDRLRLQAERVHHRDA